jgi:transposase InsO family protein
LFGISRQAIYQSQIRFDTRSRELLKVKELIQSIRMEMPRIGTRKLYKLLASDINDLGIKLGRDALFDYLRAEHMLVRPKKSYVKTTDSKHWLKKYPNLTKNWKPNKAETLFVSDITYIKTKASVHYLSLVTDAYSRKIMGYHLGDSLETVHTIKALKMAIKNRKYKHCLIHHSDRGIQYCASSYQKMLKENQIITSMTDGYDCYQNALAERVNGILKQEFLFEKANNKQELKKMIKQSVDIYNSKRPHLSLGMKTPNFVHQKTEALKHFGLN